MLVHHWKRPCSIPDAGCEAGATKDETNCSILPERFCCRGGTLPVAGCLYRTTHNGPQSLSSADNLGAEARELRAAKQIKIFRPFARRTLLWDRGIQGPAESFSARRQFQSPLFVSGLLPDSVSRLFTHELYPTFAFRSCQ